MVIIGTHAATPRTSTSLLARRPLPWPSARLRALQTQRASSLSTKLTPHPNRTGARSSTQPLPPSATQRTTAAAEASVQPALALRHHRHHRQGRRNRLRQDHLHVTTRLRQTCGGGTSHCSCRRSPTTQPLCTCTKNSIPPAFRFIERSRDQERERERDQEREREREREKTLMLCIPTIPSLNRSVCARARACVRTVPHQCSLLGAVVAHKQAISFILTWLILPGSMTSSHVRAQV